MIYICHRGNINGKILEEENNPNKIDFCLKSGYDVEIDVWYLNGELFLGHDEAQYKINEQFIKNTNLWCHAKNLAALCYMLKNKISCFWHQNDSYTITSNGYIWCYPNMPLIDNCIAVMPELANYDLKNLKTCYAICTDEVLRYKKLVY